MSAVEPRQLVLLVAQGAEALSEIQSGNFKHLVDYDINDFFSSGLISLMSRTKIWRLERETQW